MDHLSLNNGKYYDILMGGEDSGVLWLEFYGVNTIELLPVLVNPENTKRIVVRKDEIYNGYIEIIHVMTDAYRNTVSVALRKPQ